jgi:hypothetical protein
MQTRSWLIVALLVVVALVVLNSFSSAQAPKEDSESGRFTMMTVAEGAGNVGRIVVCDTKTGQCWVNHVHVKAPWEDRGTPVKAKSLGTKLILL